TRFSRDWSSDVCSSDLIAGELLVPDGERQPIRVQLEHLHLPAPTPGGTPGDALASIDPTTLPPVDLQIERVLLGDELLGKWSFRARPSGTGWGDRKSTRLNSSHVKISYAVFCLKKKTKIS